MTMAWSVDACGDPVEGYRFPLGVTRRSLAPSDDRALIERAQGGDREAFEELVHRYDRDVLRIALNILHKTEDARDVYQEAFLYQGANLPRFRSSAAFIPGRHRIVTNVCLDHLRRRSSRPEDQAPELASNLEWRDSRRRFL